MGLRYEAWTLPWDSGGFRRKFFHLPALEGTGKGVISFLTTQGEGAVDLSVSAIEAMGRSMDEIVSDTTSSLIRVFDCLPDGTNVVIDEWVCERPGHDHDDSRTVTISGPPLKTKAFDGTIVYPFDYPTQPTVIPDHIWDGKNILSDPGFENASFVNEIYEMDKDGATGGTFILTVDGNDSSAIAWNASVGTVESAIQGITGISDVRVDATDDGWVIEFVVPTDPPTDMTLTSSLTGGGGDEKLTKTQDGQVVPSSVWTISQNADASSDPKQHGTYASDGFRLTEGAEPVLDGTYAIRINGLSQYSGFQQIVQVEPGMTYQLSIWVFTSDATEQFKLVVRNIFGGLIDAVTSTVTASTWTEVSLEVTIPDEYDTVIFRFAQIVDHNPVPFYADRAAMKEGMAPSTWGEIMGMLMDDCAVDHAGDPRGTILDWVDYSSFTPTLDSGGNAWPRNEAITVPFGETMGQVHDEGVDLGYEWGLVPKAIPAGGLTHDLVIYVTGGMDDDPSTAITPGPSVTGGDSLTRTPAYTRVVAEGSGGLYVEDENATALGNFGPIEKYDFDSSLGSATSLGARTDQLIAFEQANRNAVHFQMVETLNNPRPLVAFKPGDTVPMQLPPGLLRTEKRVQDISYVNTHPTQYLVTGSRVLEGEAAAYNLLWRLWRRLEKPKRETREGGLQLTEGQGAQPTYTLALEGAHQNSKAHAHDVLGDGTTAAEGEAAIILALTRLTSGGKLVLTEGTLPVPNGSTITVPDGIAIEGFGQGVTSVIFDTNITWVMAGRSSLRHLTIDQTGG